MLGPTWLRTGPPHQIGEKGDTARNRHQVSRQRFFQEDKAVHRAEKTCAHAQPAFSFSPRLLLPSSQLLRAGCAYLQGGSLGLAQTNNTADKASDTRGIVITLRQQWRHRYDGTAECAGVAFLFVPIRGPCSMAIISFGSLTPFLLAKLRVSLAGKYSATGRP